MKLTDDQINAAVSDLRDVCFKHTDDPEELLCIVVGFSLFASRALGLSDQKMIEAFQNFAQHNRCAQIHLPQ